MKVSNSTKILILRLSIFIIYLAIGTWVFQIFERESQHKIWKSFEDRRQRVLAKYNISSQDIEQLFGQQYLTKSIEWSYGNTFVFAITVITTIGYGHMVPKTTGGRAFCMVFALVGIPGTCLVLQAVGDKISEFVAAVIITIEKKCFRRTRPKHVYIKTTVTTFVLTFFVVLPGLAIPVKIRREKWSYFECFYFNFITLSTIGFGDFVPEFHRGYDFLLVSVAFVGLSFVSSILCSLNVLIEKYGIGARFVTNRREEKNDECEEAQEDFFKVCEHFCDVDKQGVGQGKNTETKMESSTEDQKSSEMKRCSHDDSTRCEGCYRDSIQLSMFTA